MKKLIFVLLTLLVLRMPQVSAQSEMVYHFPKEVNKLILKEFEKDEEHFQDTINYIPYLTLYPEPQRTYTVFVSYVARNESEGFSSKIILPLVLSTNRFLKLSQKIKLPIIFSSDLDFGEYRGASSNGTVYYIRFNISGEIIESGY